VKVGISLKWPLNSLNRPGNVVGDELYARSIATALECTQRVSKCYLTAPGTPLPQKVDVIMHFNDTDPDSHWARKHVLYLQNGYGAGSEKALAEFRKKGFDGYAFISNRLLQLHWDAGHTGIWVPFGVDTNFFRAMPCEAALAHQVAYVGNDIKGVERTNRYIRPALKFDFGLYGNWQAPSWRKVVRDLMWLKLQPAYRREFATISRGKIPQENVPALYSSAAINLNCTLEDCVRWDVVTLRAFEVMACGGFLITDEVPSLRSVCGEAVVITSGFDDLENKIEYYLSHERERKEIARMGPEVAKNYSIDSMAHRLTDYLESMVAT
jgi:spore maturation protein CgeB